MSEYCKEFKEFLSIIHNRELLKKELWLEPFNEMGKPAIKFNLTFFTKYSQEPLYMSVISQLLQNTYYGWVDYVEASPLGTYNQEDLKNIFCDILSGNFRANGVC